jgi:hypothetical protein
MRSIYIFSFIVSIIFLNSCIPCYYAPNAHNVPLLKESGTGNASLGMKIGVYSIGCDLQGAAAVSDHVGMMFNYGYFSGSKNQIDFWGEDYKERFKSHMTEIGLGYYTTIDSMFLFEIYGGAGLEWIKNKYDYFEGTGTSDLNSACYFVQPAFGFYRKNIELAFSLRLRIVDYTNFSYDPGTDQEIINDLTEISGLPAITFLEPAFTFRAGGDQVKFQFQSGFSQILGGDQVEYDPLNINLGIIFTFGKGKKAEAIPPE